MRSGLDGIIAQQHGIFARWQALACGVTPREFDRLCRAGGPWIKVRYGVYTTRERWLSLNSDDRLLLTDRAAALVCDDDAVLSHSSAARLLGIPLYAATDQLTHLTRTSLGQSGRIQAYVKHHLASLPDDQVIVKDGLRVTAPERTVLDLARLYGYRTGLVAADAALHAGADPATLAAISAALTTEPGGPTVRAVVAEADGRAESPIETLARVTLREMGVHDLEPQYTIWFRDGGYAIGDIYSRALNHLFECDGRIKYTPQRDRFGNLISPDEVVWHEKKREDKVRGEGVGFSRLIWSDVQPDAFDRTSRRLWSEIEQQNAARHRRLPPGA